MPTSRQPALSPYRQFVNRWSSCTACPLHQTRLRVVLARGRVPADVLFVGEAPGVSEDVLGQPFVGPAGKLLDDVIRRAMEPWQVPGTEGQGYNRISYCLTNLVCCLPRDEEGDKLAEPPDEAVEACSVRLLEFVDLVRPRLVVCVGKLSRDWLDPGYKYSVKLPGGLRQVHIDHPAYILRAPYVQRGLLVQRCVVTLRDALEGL